jgi:hypothetical protein
METKLSKLKASAANGDWAGALRIAAKFPELGEHKAVIVRAHECIVNPKFYSQLGRNPAECVEAGVAALRIRYRL